MLLNLVAIDPGGETGVAWCAYNPARPKGLAPHQRVQQAFKRAGGGGCFQIQDDPNEQAVRIHEFVEERRLKVGDGRQDAYRVRTVVVGEGFTPPSKHVKDSVLLAAKVLYKAEFYLWLMYPDDEIEWRMQRPGEQHGVTDEMLRRWGLWKPGKKNDDAMSAVKHLIVLARKLHSEG